ncbi:branched-chain amino acid ABC transporter ATP-binding protein/permease [Chitinimonas sp.]|uniref:branched-chain amino acid ABC transporter ATP-binding protein/permease n=1 Tax=Chitinimonas sp. TaxID=1934313 RepID=UPI002F929F7A
MATKMTNQSAARIAEIVALLVMAALPFVIGKSGYGMGLITLLTIYAIALIGLDATVGYLGQVNLAHAGMIGIGAYVAGLVVAHTGLGILPALLAAGVAGLVLGALLAFPALRLEGPQFALATLSFGSLAVLCLNEMESVTMGAQGLSVNRPPLPGGIALTATTFYWVTLALLALLWFASRQLMEGRWGRAIAALRNSPIATDALGIGALKHKVLAFAFGSALGGFAGGLYAFNLGFLQPQAFGYDLSVTLLLGTVLGGRKSVWGALVGAILVVLLPNLLSNKPIFLTIAGLGALLALVHFVQSVMRREITFQNSAPLAAMALLLGIGVFTHNLEDWRKGLFALMLFAVVVGLPDGLMGFIGHQLARLLRLAAAPGAAPTALDQVLPVRQAQAGAVVEVKDAKLHFGGVKAVDGVTLSLQQGEALALIGPNGSGKSSLINVISGLYKPTAGEVWLRHSRISGKGLLAASQHGISRTFQNLQIFADLSAIENVAIAMKGAYRKNWLLVALGLARREDQKAMEDAQALLQLVGLQEKAGILASDLTYSDQRFMEIARALAAKPEVLILDEPAAGMSKPDVERLKVVIGAIKARGISIILIEHHLDVVAELADRVIVLDGGKQIAGGTAAEVRRNPQVIEAYLGTSANHLAEAEA